MKALLRCALATLAVTACYAQLAGTNAIVLGAPGYRVPSPSLEVAPGQVTVLHVNGIATSIEGNVTAVPGPAGLPHVLNGISVDLVQGKNAVATSLELRALYQTRCVEPCTRLTGITLQIPFELETDFGVRGEPGPWLRISENGRPVGGVALTPVTDNVHVLNTCDDTQAFVSAAVSVPQNICAHVVMVGGSLNSLYNLAHGGEQLAVWLYGMGAKTAPAPDCCLSPEQLSKPVQSFQLNFDFRPNAPASPPVAGFGVTGAPLFAAYVGGGMYQVNFSVPRVPAGLPACDGVKVKSNLTVTVAGPNSLDAAQICVAP